MEPDHDVLGLEQAGWRALATAGAAEEFYRRVLDDPVVFLLPGGLRIDDREAIVDSISGPPWDWYRLDDAHVLVLGADVACVHYRAEAQRGDTAVYEALIASTYVRRPGGWRLALHQQTPT